MKLVNLRIEPVGRNGWGSKLLTFAKHLTQLYGPNGCGKTPVMHSIAYALGYPVKFRDDIYANCSYVVLDVEHGGKKYCFRRKIDPSKLVLTCSAPNVEDETFYNERDFSAYLFGIVGIQDSTLTSSSTNAPVYSYISTFLPLFYVDQDTGYTSFYKTQSLFIKDQFAEMVRLALSFPPKNAYERKRLFLEKQGELKDIDLKIVEANQYIEKLLNARASSTRSVQDLTGDLERLTEELELLRTSQDATALVDSSLIYAINEKAREQSSLENQIQDLETRINGFEKIQEEIEVEINTLSLNEEARRHFSSFEEICSNTQCQLFFRSSESYAKNLLYLRDQIKDLERNNASNKVRLVQLNEFGKRVTQEIGHLRSKVSSTSGVQTSSNLVSLISSLTRSIIDIQKEKELLEKIERESSSYVGLLNNRNSLQDDLASMGGSRDTSDLRVIEFRAMFKKKIVEWLNILQTKNVSREIVVDNDFGILFGNEKLSQFSGSTLLRVVLATKAAFFDIYVSSYSPKIQFMIFDTPRQHDIEANHLGAFIIKLKKLASDKDCQIVFSTTEYHYSPQENDIDWVPLFSGFEQDMFLGTIVDTPG